MNERIPHPHHRGMVVIAGLVLLSLIPILAGIGLVLTDQSGYGTALIFIGGLLLFIFGVSLAVAWWSGRREIDRIRDFLASDRPLIRWTYGPEIWADIQAARWMAQLGDARLQLGCLAAMFAVVGLLTGGLIGADEGVRELLLGGLMGAGGGALVGLAIGGTIAGASRLGARRALGQGPETVALGRDEIYANGQYFRGDGDATYIVAARIESEEAFMILAVDLQMPRRPRMPETQTWEIAVPPEARREVTSLVKEGKLTNERQYDTL
ncbi:MAG: hypothetical protein JXC32_11215 [Anaerolineae bacterium]|nr:hypothetical protein [Anaerolineae bacterium]